jgi:hypothetical protein
MNIPEYPTDRMKKNMVIAITRNRMQNVFRHLQEKDSAFGRANRENDDVGKYY